MDIGSSTGGFTEFALNSGASHVIAIEKGTNQMKSPLRFDPRIDLHEKTDIFDVTREVLGLCDYFETAEKPHKNKTHLDVILADVSFISLKKVNCFFYCRKCKSWISADNRQKAAGTYNSSKERYFKVFRL